jgi:DNA repair protein RadC
LGKKNVSKRVSLVSIKLVREGSVLYKDRTVSSPTEAYNLVKTLLEDLDRENFIVVSLNTKNEPTQIEFTSKGNLNSSIVAPREVFKSAILSSAASILIAHNHPSGNPTPSKEDLEVTKRLKDCGNLLGIEVLDHIIVGDGKYVSLKEKGHI